MIIRADARALPLRDGCVDCCVTSPPYFGLRDYGNPQQIGLESTPDAFVASLVTVCREVKRVLKDSGTLWLNLGDSYAGSGRGAWDVDDAVKDAAGVKEVYRPRKHPIGNTAREAAMTRSVGDDRLYGFKAKDLMGIPWRVAFALQADGWYLRSDIIWAKPNPMPESVTDRPTKAHEYLFLLAKSERYYYDADAIMEPVADSQVGRIRADAFGGSSWLERQQHSAGSIYRLDHRDRVREDGGQLDRGLPFETIKSCPVQSGLDEGANLCQPGARVGLVDGAQFDNDLQICAESGECFSGHTDILQRTVLNVDYKNRAKSENRAIRQDSDCADGEEISGGMGDRSTDRRAQVLERRRDEAVSTTETRNKRSVWTVATEPYSGAHFATFPEKLIEPCILAGCPAGGIVLDPFLGSGTVGAVAERFGRRWVGTDLSYHDLALERTAQRGLFI